jgi:hypothetical protein
MTPRRRCVNLLFHGDDGREVGFPQRFASERSRMLSEASKPILMVLLMIATAIQAVASEPVKLPPKKSWQQYLEESTVPRKVIDQFLQGPGWAQFDPEVGYILGNYLPVDGMDGSATISTVQANGARTTVAYADRKARINAYGDSFTLCHQVSDAETWEEYLAGHLGEPVRNFGMGGFGVYQAYRRMIREEKTDHGAEYLIFYIWGDDPIRSLLRARWADIYQWFTPHLQEGRMFHANFWSNVEMDLDTGRFVEKEQLLPTRESLYHMSDSRWMVDHLKDDLALQLSAYSNGRIRDLDQEKISRLAVRLQFPFDWRLRSQGRVSNSSPGQPPMTPMQSQAAALLDRYSLRATRFILDKAREFSSQNGKKLLVVLFDPYRAMVQMKRDGTRYDQEIVDYLAKEKIDNFDMNEVHLLDFKKYDLSWEDYMKQYFIGHYNPAGNHFFAYSIKRKVVQWLDPKPIPYQQPEQQSINFEGYLRGYH